MTVAADSNVFPRLLDLDYPVIARGEGVRLYTDTGFEVLDAQAALSWAASSSSR